MGVQTWKASVAWTACFGAADPNGIVTGNAILSTTALTNTVEDTFCDISFSLGSITPTGASFIGFYIHPLNQDASTYGDGRFGASAAGPPGSVYFAGNVTLVNAAQVQTGTLRGVILPFGAFKFVLFNSSGVSLAGSANTIKYQTYNLIS